jgi:hypothetical protein
VIDQIETLRRLVLEAQAKGHSSMILAVARPALKRRAPRARVHVQIAPGLTGRWMGDIEEPGKTGCIADVSVEDAKAWLKRRAVASRPVNQ